MKQHYDYYDGSDSEDESPGPPRPQMQQHPRPPAVISYPKSRSIETCLDSAPAKNKAAGAVNHRFMYSDNR